MKLRQMIAKKKLEATAVRRSNASTRAASMEEEEEPTMRLSTAFIVVLLLHIVAIGGVYTFDAVKMNRSSKSKAEASESAKEIPATAAAAGSETLAPVSPAAALANAGQETTPASTTPVANKAIKAVATAPATTTTKVAATTTASKPASLSASGKVHVVEKGENPVAIAKKHGVDYDDLLKLNKIDDPRRLRIGQKLQIPTK